MNRTLLAVALTAVTLTGLYVVWSWAGRKAEPAEPAGACGPLWSENPEGLPKEWRAQIRAIDVARVPDRSADLLARGAAAERERRELRSLAGIAERPASVEVFVWGTMFGGRASLTARRNAVGDWLVEEIEELGPALVEPGGAKLSKGWFAIGGEPAARLDRLLADPCLYAEPTYLDNEVPLVGGESETCADGGNMVVVINHAGRTRKAFQACTQRGKTGDVASLLFEAML